jgi:hypothetical protein
MTPSATLIIKPRGEASGPFLPEQEVPFDIALRNDGSARAEFVSISGNMNTPVIRVRDASGTLLGQYTRRNASERMNGDASTRVQRQPKMVRLAPGAEDQTFFNVWRYREPLGPGNYSVEVAHRPAPAADPIVSQRIPFSIVRAKVITAAMGFESAQRFSTILAWLAAAEGGRPRLLARLSGMAGHGGLNAGATMLGEYPAETRLAVGEIPPEGEMNWMGWIAAVTGSHAELIRHNMIVPAWRSGPLALPLQDAVPVPRFPDRGHAVLLVTGSGQSGPVLCGLVVEEEGGAQHRPWTLPLPLKPQHSACLFGAHNPIILLFAGDDGRQSSLYRLVVDESGKMLVPAERVRQTENVVLAVASDLRLGETPTFLVLEAERDKLDRNTLVHVPLRGPAAEAEPRQMGNWPKDSEGRAGMPAAVAIEAAGSDVAIALTDAQGRLFGGTAAGSIQRLSSEGVAGLVSPHIGAIQRSTVFSAFRPDGLIYYAARAGAAH